MRELKLYKRKKQVFSTCFFLIHDRRRRRRLTPSATKRNSFFLPPHLSQRGEVVEVLDDVRIKHRTIVLCHIQRAVSQYLLESKSIPAAINEVFAGKGVSEEMDGCLLDASALVVADDGFPQSILGEGTTSNIAKERVCLLASAEPQILFEDADHFTTQWYHLGFVVLVVSIMDQARIQIHIAYLNSPHSRCSAPAV